MNKISRPRFLNPIFENIPQELKERPQWVCWKGVKKQDKKKLSKVPYNAKTGKHAKVDDSDTWCDYQTAEDALNTGKYDGIGFVLTKDDPYVGLDFDHCRDSDTGEINNNVKRYIDQLNSYTEISPSGTGIRILVRGELPPKGRKKSDVEVYEHVRYLTITGHRVEKMLDAIEERQKETMALHSEVFSAEKSSVRQKNNAKGNPLPDDHELLKKAFASKIGARIKKLHDGDWSDYSSQSEADLALCSYLAFWCGPDEKRIDRIFKSSGLYRDKWDEKHYADGRTYGQETIRKAIDSAGKFYDPRFRESNQVPGNNVANELNSTDADGKDENEQDSYSEFIRKSVIPMEDFVKMAIPPRPLLLDPWLRPGTLALISAPRGIGKTWLCLSIFLSIARGASLGKWKAENAAGCLYIDGEMSGDELQGRLKKLSSKCIPLSAPADLLTSEIMQEKDFPTPNLTDPLWRESIFQFVKEKGCYKVVFIDNLSSLTPGLDENAKQDWDPINQWLLSIRRLGIAVIMVHHMSKSGDQRGTSAREDNIDVSIRLTRPRGYKAVDGAMFEIEYTKARSVNGAGIMPFGLKLTEIDGVLEWTILNKTNENKCCIVGMLVQGLSQKDIAKEVKRTPGYISQVRKEAIGKGWLTDDNTLTDAGAQHFGVMDKGSDV